MSFANLGLSDELLRAVEESGYVEPTPIQKKAIPSVLMGRDILGCAQTGTGKTASFTLPMIDILAQSRAKARMPRAIILEPTRELAAQVAENFDRYGKYHRLAKALLIGGISLAPQEKQIERGADVLIATPGRFLDCYERGLLLLHDVKILVIDEADRMLDMGFIPDVERIVRAIPKNRQTLLFSATILPEIRRLADSFLNDPKEISVSSPTAAAETVEQFLIAVGEREKDAALLELIASENVKSAIIFCNRKKQVDALAYLLKKKGLNAAPIHGDLPQSRRMETLESLRKGELDFLVASDVAARGLDIPEVSHVFNYGVPVTPEDYIHRIGRTGRAGRSGRAFMMVIPEEGEQLGAILRMTGKEIPWKTLEGRHPPEIDLTAKPKRRFGRQRRGGKSPATSAKPQQQVRAQTTPAPQAKPQTATPAPQAATPAPKQPTPAPEKVKKTTADGPDWQVPAFLAQPVPTPPPATRSRRPRRKD
ncbi:MAG: DNA helicase [Rhodospirillaceae bacterium]|nr:MAG: DNA helicase [Rhodospirillaceae bacterium]